MSASVIARSSPQGPIRSETFSSHIALPQRLSAALCGSARAGMRTRPGGVEFGIVHRLNRVRFAGMPLTPARRHNVITHFGIQKNHFGIRTPRTPQPHSGHAGVGSEPAVVEDKAAVLIRIMLGLSRDKALRVRGVVNLAVIEDRFAVAKDEIHVASDIAVSEILSRRDARLPIRPAIAAAQVDRILISQQTHVPKNGLVAGHKYGQRLRARRELRMRRIPVVREGQIFGKEIICVYLYRRRVQGTA